MRKFEFEKTYEEIEIAGDVYKLDFSDNKLQEFYRAFSKFQAEVKELDKLDADKMTEQEALEGMERQKAAIVTMIEGLFGEGTFEPLYKKAGESVFNMARLLSYITQLLTEKSEELKPDKNCLLYTSPSPRDRG